MIIDPAAVTAYRRPMNPVGGLLCLELSRTDIAEPSGKYIADWRASLLGLRGLCKKLGNAQVCLYQPAKRHAVLEVNSAKMLAAFTLDTKDFKLARGSS